MKTIIKVTGQISSNKKLAEVINNFNGESEIVGDSIEFKTKKEAQKALWDAFQYLKSNEYRHYRYGGIKYRKDRLIYDTSTASIKTV